MDEDVILILEGNLLGRSLVGLLGLLRASIYLKMKRYFHVLCEIDDQRTSCMKSPSPWPPTILFVANLLENTLLHELMSYYYDPGHFSSANRFRYAGAGSAV